MRIGILADIHANLEKLEIAIDRLQDEQVDKIVALGDLIYDRSNASETVDMIMQIGAVGVFGNHELGLCVEPDAEIHAMYTKEVMDFFGTLSSHLEINDILFSHTLPHQDATDPAEYCLAPKPEEPGALDPTFAQFPQRIMLCGHFHRWFVSTPAGPIDFDGQRPLQFDPTERYFIVVHAVMDGWAAIVDDEQNMLIPIQL